MVGRREPCSLVPPYSFWAAARIGCMNTVIYLTVMLFPFHVVCIGLLALFCQDALVKKRVTIWSLLALTTVVALELAMWRLVVTLSR